MMIYAVTPSVVSAHSKSMNVRNCNVKKQDLTQKNMKDVSFGSVVISYPKKVESKSFVDRFMNLVSDVTPAGYRLRINKNTRNNLQYGELALSKPKVKDGQVTRKLMAKSVYDEICMLGGYSLNPMKTYLGLDVKFQNDGALPIPKVK